MKKLVALAVAIACSSSVFAQSVGQWYGEASYAKTTVTDTSGDELGKFKFNGISLGAGKVLVDNLAVEGFVNLPSSTATNNYDGPSTLSVKQKTGYGVSLRPFVKLNSDLELFGRLGRATSKRENAWSNQNGSGSETVSEKNNFYGLGLAYGISKESSVVVDYRKITGVEGAKVSSFSVGVRYNF